MKQILIVLLSATLASAGFAPDVRVDHENRPSNACFWATTTVGPSDGQTQPVYVAFEDDSSPGLIPIRSDIMFQKSTDAGATWLPQDVIARRGDPYVGYPHITTDLTGSIYIAYTDRAHASEGEGHVCCVRSTDSGATWSEPARIDDNPTPIDIGYARIVADSAGNLLAAWNQWFGGDHLSHLFASTSTDHGVTWRPKVRLDDTAYRSCFNADVAVQPGSNIYLVLAYNRNQPFIYRSMDGGLSFQRGVPVDTAGQGPRIVADREHIICDYTAVGCDSRTFYSGPDTWGSPVSMTYLDSLHSAHANGGALALSPDGTVHTTLMILDPAGYDVCYAYSTNHGATWSERVLVNDITTYSVDPDITADSAGRVHVVWQDFRNGRNEIWSSTGDPPGMAETRVPRSPDIKLTVAPSFFVRTTTIRVSASTSIARRPALSVYDASGRLIRSFTLPSSPTGALSLTWNGSDDAGRRGAPGAYLVRAGGAVAKVVLLPAD